MQDKRKKDQRTEKKIEVDLIHTFGAVLNTDVKQSVYFLEHESTRIIYPIGKRLAIKVMGNEKLDDHYDMKYIKLNEEVTKILAIAISKDRTKMAVSEKLDIRKRPTITIYSLMNVGQTYSATNQVFTFTEGKKQAEFTKVCFSQDKESRFIACVTDETEPQLVFYDLKKSKNPITAPLTGTVDKISINPDDTHTIAITGDQLMMVYRVHESSIRAFPNIPKLDTDQRFTDHDWLDPDHLIVGTDKGKMFIITRKDQKFSLNHMIRDSFYTKDIGVCSIKAFSKGIIIASDLGHFAFWKKFDSAADEEPTGANKKLYLHSHWQPPSLGTRVMSIDISAKEESLLIGFRNNHIATCNLAAICSGEVPMVIGNELDYESERTEMRLRMKDVKFSYVYRGFHYGQIDFIEVCAQRPLVATCSNEDSFVRIWNYMDFRSEFSFRTKLDAADGELTKALQCMAFHPNGYYLALGTISAVRMIYIMEERPFEYRDLNLKNVTLLKFSRGGQYLAAAQKKPNSSHYKIFILNSYTLEVVDDYPAHTNKCTDMVWGYHDEALYSCGEDGLLKIWSKFSKADEQASEKNFQYYSLTCDKEATIFFVGEEIKDGVSKYVIREKQQKSPMTSHPFPNKKPTRITLFESTLNHEALIVGTESGRIHIYSKNLKEGDYQKLSTHIDAVTAICSDINGRYLFTAGKDGLLNIYQVISKINESIQKEIEEGTDGTTEVYNPRSKCVKKELADVVLVDRKDIDSYIEQMDNHKRSIEELKTKLEHKAMEQKNKLEEERKKAEDEMRAQMTLEHERYNQLVTAKQNVDAENTNLLKANDENHLKAVEDLEALYEKKLTYENDKYIRLENELLEERLNNEKKLNEIKEKNKEIIEELKREFKASYDDAKKIYENTQSASSTLDKEYKARLAQQEEEHELEIRELNAKHKEELSKSLKQNSRLHTDLEVAKQELKKAKGDKAEFDKRSQEKDDEIKSLKSKVSEQEVKIEKLKKELEETSEALRKKEKSIYDAKSKINDLQKAKHVLSFRTTEMRKSLEPKEAQIEKLKEELYKLQNEFEINFVDGQKKEEEIKRKEEKIAKLTIQMREQVVITNKKENELNKIKMDLFNCSKMKDNKSLVQEFNKIYQKNVVEDKIKHEKQDPKSIAEMKRQIDYLENQLRQINISTDKLVKNRELLIMKRTKHNIELINDLNELKKSNKDLSENNKSLSSKNASLNKTNQSYKNEILQLTETIQRLSKQKAKKLGANEEFQDIREQIGPQQNASQSMGNSQYQGEEDAGNLSDIIQGNPEKARDMMIGYKQEIGFLRGKLKALNVQV